MKGGISVGSRTGSGLVDIVLIDISIFALTQYKTRKYFGIGY